MRFGSILLKLMLLGALLTGACRKKAGENVAPDQPPLIRLTATISTDSVMETNVTATTASISGLVGVPKGAKVKRYGFYYSSTRQLPTAADGVAVVGDTLPAVNPFVIQTKLASLSPNTVYYVRAFALYDTTAYGQVRRFKTKANPVVTTVQTGAISSVSLASATVQGTLTGATAHLSEYGFVYALTATPTVTDKKITIGTTTPTSIPANFSTNLAGLSANTTYYVRAFAKDNAGIVYGEVKSFKTTSLVAATVATNAIAAISYTSVAAAGSITTKGTSKINEYGFVYSNTNTTPTTADKKVLVSAISPTVFPSNFNTTVSGLTTNTTYYLRAYAKDTTGFVYGEVKTFTTLATVAPSVVTSGVVARISYFTALVEGSITGKGSSDVTEYGFVYSSTAATPTLADTKALVGSTSPSSFPTVYSSSFSGLVPNTTYYFRAYATSAVGTSYGAVQSFKTVDARPITSTLSANYSEAGRSITVEGRVDNSGGGAITRYGFVYGMVALPTVDNNNVVEVGTSLSEAVPYAYRGAFSLFRVSPYGTYYVRSFATNAYGTTYGASIAVETYASPTTTTGDYTVANYVATLSGSIDTQGSATIQEHGFVFVLAANAGTGFSYGGAGVTTLKNTATPASFPFSYSLQATGTVVNTDYSYKSYVKTANGIVYGAVKTFYVHSKD